MPQHIEREIDWVMAHPRAENAASILDAAYSLDPSHPLILFALSALEKNPATQALYRDLGLERLPADARLCARAAEILKLQGDRPRALAAAEKALALDPRYPPALAVQPGPARRLWTYRRSPRQRDRDLGIADSGHYFGPHRTASDGAQGFRQISQARVRRRDQAGEVASLLVAEHLFVRERTPRGVDPG